MKIEESLRAVSIFLWHFSCRFFHGKTFVRRRRLGRLNFIYLKRTGKRSLRTTRQYTQWHSAWKNEKWKRLCDSVERKLFLIRFRMERLRIPVRHKVGSLCVIRCNCVVNINTISSCRFFPCRWPTEIENLINLIYQTITVYKFFVLSWVDSVDSFRLLSILEQSKCA